ncbi:glycoside-pentoside-hexuronide (GPH):cation symporter [Terribacillus saccharophilus]|uniref:MFS transporter n=1 Tax=Terribacillus saccharophilus TaxID=361277 RepID=UPI003981C997
MKVEKEVSLNHNTSPSKKDLGTDSLGVQKTMRLKHYLGDGSTMIATNTISGLVGMLTFFYTDKIGLAAGTVGTILLLSRIFDAFSDLVMGKLVDSTKSKHGKARPWILWMTLPTIIGIILLFTIPANASMMTKNIYAFLTVTLVTGIIYTAIVIPYSSLMALRTRSSEERGKMGITRAVFGYVIGMVIAIMLIPVSNMLGGDQRAWIIIGVVLGVISSIALFITFITSKEENTTASTEQAEAKVSFIESIKLLFKNKYFVIMLFVNFLMQMMYTLNGSTGVYYTKYILGNENLVGIMGGVGLIPVLVGFIAVGPMMKKFGLTKTVQIGFVIGIIATGLRCFMPYSFTAALVLGSLATFATIPMMSIGGVLFSNTIEYGEWKTGKRLVGMINSASSFGMKIGMGLGAAIIGWILAFGSYDGTLAVQPESAINSILLLTVYLPFALFLISYLILRKFDLDKKYPQIVKELDERRNSVTK